MITFELWLQLQQIHDLMEHLSDICYSMALQVHLIPCSIPSSCVKEFGSLWIDLLGSLHAATIGVERSIQALVDMEEFCPEKIHCSNLIECCQT